MSQSQSLLLLSGGLLALLLIVALPLILRQLMASPSHFQFHPVTVRVAAAGAMLIEDRTHHDTIPDPGTDRYLVHEWQVFFSSQVAKKVTSRNEVANPKL
ncbi:hypothetical protein QBC32DRAFT_351985 [Pseudoneurospora amorphoporcata]|uniref:Uncharacterized protein n=1 Tax=Pseudoneurospora amorphoporcata TaxID=241081 RepID=A0AAN6SBM7_9PEZI|nr:hypothetical protein QBC32DRAFT_351985 [Pseudoneurospora amorphoporcata]